MEKLPQPFLDGSKQHIPDGKRKDVVKMKTWMASQPHLPVISDEYVYMFLHACYFNQDKTKHTIETYFSLRTNTPSLFSDRNVYGEKMQNLMELAYFCRLPKLTPEGYRILVYAVKNADYSRFNFAEGVKGFCMYNDCVLSEDGIVEGYVVVFDMKHLSVGHLARVSLPALRSLMVYIQEAHPVRLKAIHIMNTASFIHHVMRLVQPLVRAEILNLVKFHRGTTLTELPLELLPADYGGEGPSIAEMDKEVLGLVDKYAKWLLETEDLKCDETKRVKKPSWWSLFHNWNTPTLTADDFKSPQNIEQLNGSISKLQID